MSATYPQFTETNYPDATDTMTRMSDASYANKSLIDQYYAYKNTGNDAAAAQMLLDNPSLDAMIINAKKINKFIDAVLALENWYNDDIKPFFETRFSNKGEYSPSTTYLQGNVISYNGEGFICRIASSAGISPTAHTNNTNWAIIAKQGIQGESGTGLAPRGVWDSATSYYVNDCVAYNNALWQCSVANSNSEPTVENTNWISLLNLNITWDDVSGKPNSFTPSAHTHGNISDNGSIGSTSGLPIFSGTGGVLEVLSTQVALAKLGYGYGTCATAAATAAKVVTMSNFVLSVGAVIGVNFANKNTASSPTLNVNGVGAKAVYFNGNVVSTSQIQKMAYFQYDGTYWQLLNGPAFQIVTGSYTGTGTYGSGSPNSLSFPFAPAVVFVVANTSTLYNYEGNPMILVKGRTAKFYVTPGITQSEIKPTFSENSVSWYATADSYAQRNESGQQHTYVAIG